MDRRKLLKTAPIAAVCPSVLAKLSQSSSSKEEMIRKYCAGSLPVEFTCEKGLVKQTNPNLRFAFSKCYGCFDVCGARLTIDDRTGRVIRAAGNPYMITANAGNPFDMSVPPREAMARLCSADNQKNRATLCGRGNAVLDAFKDKHRVTACLKRAGKRGENRWKTIPYETLLKEVVEGGDLFGEGPVEGLRSIWHKQTPANPERPDFGPYRNRLFIGYNSEQGCRSSFLLRFAGQCWGTGNLGCKDSYCGHQQVAGCALGCFDAVDEGALPTVDYEHAEFVIFLGTNPGLSGISLNSGARRLAKARTQRKDFKYVVIDPILRGLTTETMAQTSQWIPIRAAGDMALLFGMMQVILNKGWYREAYLAAPSQAAADRIGEINYTNASYLIVTDEKHPLYRHFLTAKACGLAEGEAKAVLRKKDGKLVSADTDELAELMYEGPVTLSDGTRVNVITALARLKKRVNEYAMATYVERCGISATKIEALAREWTSHGRRVAIETNTACNASDGGGFGYAMIILATLVGAHNAKGGMLHMGGCGYESLFDVEGGPLFDLNVPEPTPVEGVNAERSGNYEESHEYAARVKAGLNPYPAEQPWNNTFVQNNSGEMLVAHTNANPYTFKAWINWATNPLYNCAGLAEQVREAIADPHRLGLMIGIDPYINETNVYADYLIPDTLQYEQWMLCRLWGSELSGDVACFPVVEPQTGKTAAGHTICMEQFLIDAGKAIGLPGLGEKGFKSKDGEVRRLDVPEDYFVPYFANVALSGPALPAPTRDDIVFTGVDRIESVFAKRLSAKALAPTLFMLTRGGCYLPVASRYDGEFFTESLRMDTQFQLYNESLAELVDSYSGRHLDGQPVYDVDRFWSGEALRDRWPESDYPFVFTSFKVQLRSPYSAVLPRITALSQTNYLQVHEADAAAVGIKNGDRARLVMPRGSFIEGQVQADNTVARATVVVPTGYGHTQFGASDMIIDGRQIRAQRERAGGMPVNAFNINDPTRPGAGLYRDNIFGSTARHGIPCKLVKVS